MCTSSVGNGEYCLGGIFDYESRRGEGMEYDLRAINEIGQFTWMSMESKCILDECSESVSGFEEIYTEKRDRVNKNDILWVIWERIFEEIIQRTLR